MAAFDIESVIKRGVERALNEPIMNGKSVMQWAEIGIHSQVVRCKDCEYWVPGVITDQDDFIPPKCGKYSQMVGHSADDFCSLGKKEVTQDD